LLEGQLNFLGRCEALIDHKAADDGVDVGVALGVGAAGSTGIIG